MNTSKLPPLLFRESWKRNQNLNATWSVTPRLWQDLPAELQHMNNGPTCYFPPIRLHRVLIELIWIKVNLLSRFQSGQKKLACSCYAAAPRRQYQSKHSLEPRISFRWPKVKGHTGLDHGILKNRLKGMSSNLVQMSIRMNWLDSWRSKVKVVGNFITSGRIPFDSLINSFDFIGQTKKCFCSLECDNSRLLEGIFDLDKVIMFQRSKVTPYMCLDNKVCRNIYTDTALVGGGQLVELEAVYQKGIITLFPEAEFLLPVWFSQRLSLLCRPQTDSIYQERPAL